MVQQVRLRRRLTLSGAMSPNAIIHQAPEAGALFDQLHIDRQQEGCDSLDELAWRRGMNVAEVLEALKRLSASDRPRRSGAADSAS
jgi:iron-sulfur cluster repair protein YtfE (RIC family)